MSAQELYDAIVRRLPTRVGRYLPSAVRDREALRAVVELHRPFGVTLGRASGEVAYWECRGCDAGLYAESNADTPCATLLLIAEKLGVS